MEKFTHKGISIKITDELLKSLEIKCKIPKEKVIDEIKIGLNQVLEDINEKSKSFG